MEVAPTPFRAKRMRASLRGAEKAKERKAKLVKNKKGEW
jgi:hypothetical protein